MRQRRGSLTRMLEAAWQQWPQCRQSRLEASGSPPQRSLKSAETLPLQEMQPGAELSLTPGVTVTALSRTIHLYSDSCSPVSLVPRGGASSRLLVVLLPWFGAQPHSIAKYLELYLPQGLDVLVVESALSHFLWPRSGLAYAASVLGLLQDSRFCTRLLLVHAFSIGGYTFAQMMVHMSREPERHQQVAVRIRGLIYDSLVMGRLEDMALGVAQMISPPLFWPLIRSSTLLYFSLLRCCTVRYYKAAVAVFFQPPLRCPALLFHCSNDPLSNPILVQELVEKWRRAGIVVQAQGWQDSRHAAHLRQHPEEYQAVLQEFLKQLDIALLQAKL